MFPAGILWFVLWLVFSILFRFIVPALTGGRRTYKRAALRWNFLFQQFQSVHGGTIQRSGRRTLLYIWGGGQISVRIEGAYSRLKIHSQAVPARKLRFTRIPRLPFAFFRSFIDEEHQIGDLPYVASRDTEDLAGLKSNPDFWRLLSRLNEAHLSVNSDSQGVTLSRRVRNSEIEDLELSGMIELADSLAQFRNPLSAEIPVHAIDSQQRCAYCKESLDTKLPLIRCAACATPHHRECFELNGHCAVYGCTSRIPAKEPVLLSR
ncbi:MAG TPA: RING finger protein [Acidobacteriota bacterium]|nr:RING finger protein [Acidobacteriota bacterium]